jgi:hypothetical protein
MSHDDRYEAWLERYLRAWETNDPDDVGSLFTEDARYFTDPEKEPWVGRDAIVAGWIEHRDTPGDWTFEHDVLAATDRVGIVRGETRYRTSGKTYLNLWEIYLDDDGRAREFVEWFKEVPAGG